MHFHDDDFDHEDFHDPESEQEFRQRRKQQQQRLHKHPLFRQAHEILELVDALINSAANTEEAELYAPNLRESAMIIVAKLAAGLQSDSYVVCMQQAAIIREHAESLRLSNHLLKYAEGFDERYIGLFREEMEKFRELFKEWAAAIKTMDRDFGDEEWGLF
jgi:hypothetical protein